jgi:hypothetical protein
MNKTFNFQELREYAYGIVDAAMVEQLPEGFFAEPLVPKRLTQSAHLMPTLVDLRRTPIDRLNALLNCLNKASENNEPPAIALFIKSDSSATEIRRYWNAMQLAQPRLSRPVWLRLHDPRVLHQMFRVLDPNQRRKLFGLSQEFTYWICGEWVTAVRQPCSALGNHLSKNSEVNPYAGPAKWNWGRIERIGLVNRAMLAAGLSKAAALTTHGALAEQLIERAVGQYALFEPADLVEFAIRGLQAHPAFDKHRAVAYAIRPAAASAGDSSLADRFALIDEQVWSSLRQPINPLGDSQHECGNKM